MPADEPNLPSTIERSSKKAQRTYAKTLESAEETYEGDAARAHRTAFSALKHSTFSPTPTRTGRRTGSRAETKFLSWLYKFCGTRNSPKGTGRWPPTMRNVLTPWLR